jgi:CRP-like cAMP-binding protein
MSGDFFKRADRIMEGQQEVGGYRNTSRTTVTELREVAIFLGLEDRVLQRIADIAESRVFEAGHRLFGQGDLEAPFCLLISGQISSFRTAPDGTVTVVDVTQPSGHSGLQGLLTQLPALVGVETVAPSRMVIIDSAGFRALLPEEPSLATAVLRAEAMTLRSLVLQVCDLKLRTTAQRLGHYLLELAPDQGGHSATLRLPFDKRLLAARLGCRQENLSRAFATLRDMGVETRGARVVLHDIPKLRDYAVAFEGPAE